jgi:hypothetical protein
MQNTKSIARFFFLLTAYCLLPTAYFVQGQTIAEPGFETPALGHGNFQYGVPGSAWTFAGGSGLSANGSGFTRANPPAPQGSQVAFLQASNSRASQTIAGWAAGDYQFSVQACQRHYGPMQQSVRVLFDGMLVGTIRPVGITYQTYYTPLFHAGPGDHTVSFEGVSASGDNTAFVDDVRLLRPGDVAASVTLADGWVGSSGKTVGFRFATSDGKPVAGVVQAVRPPELYRNGLALSPLGAMADLDGNQVALYPLAAGESIGSGDTVTASAGGVWLSTSAGIAAPLYSQALANRVGRSPLPPSLLEPRTLRPGVNNNTWPSGPWGNYWPYKNWAYKCTWPPGDLGKLKGRGTIRVYSNAGANGVDQTGYPGPAGLWLVYWKSSPGPNGEAPASFSLTTVNPASTVVTERADMSRVTGTLSAQSFQSTPLAGRLDFQHAPGSTTAFQSTSLAGRRGTVQATSGGYQGRVYDFQHAATSTTANIDVALSFNDPSSKGNYEDLWIVGPGDFDCRDDMPVTLDTSDPFALSRTYTQWLPQGVGSLRWVDSSNCGGSPRSCPYPELLMTKSDRGWGELGARSVRYGFTAIGPVDTAATPWMYSPHYRKDSERYAATLADPITTAPAVGTAESYTFPDADTAPLMAGLEVQVDSEVMRILTVSGSSVKLYRGSNGTKPAAHAAGPVKVSGRRPIGIPPSGIIGNGYTYQLTTSVPHGQFTGSLSFSTVGTGWPSVTWSDGSTTGRLDARFPLVTGPNTLVSWVGPSAKPSGAKPVQVYPLDPALCYSEMRYGSYIPPEVTAITTGKFPRAALHVNINLDACDDFVWHYMRLIRDHFPAGRSVIVEYQNEPWNWGFTGFEYCMKAADYLGYENPYSLSYYMRRSAEVGAIARAVFAEKGRAGEILLMLNCQLGSDQPKNHLAYAARNGWQVDRIGNAPYLHPDTGLAAFTTWDDDQLCDLWPMFLWFDSRPASYNGYVASAARYIADYNAATGGSCKLAGYEGGIEHAVPTSIPGYHLRGLDLVYNPHWYWFEDTFYRWLQRQGFSEFHVYSLSQYHSPHLWGMYHWPRQKPGYGDGRHGGTDNRLRLARPGQPNSKPANVNVDENDSVRGQAFIDWLRAVPAQKP